MTTVGRVRGGVARTEVVSGDLLGIFGDAVVGIFDDAARAEPAAGSSAQPKVAAEGSRCPPPRPFGSSFDDPSRRSSKSRG